MPAPALLIVDVQRAFVNEHTAHIPPLVEKLQYDYAVVYAACFLLDTSSLFAKNLGMAQPLPRTEGAAPAFIPAQHTRMYTKSGFSALDARLQLELQMQEIDEVHLCGLDTDACVATTALALFDVNVRPVVLADACASSGGRDAHIDGLRMLSRHIGENQVRRGTAKWPQKY